MPSHSHEHDAITATTEDGGKHTHELSISGKTKPSGKHTHSYHIHRGYKKCGGVSKSAVAEDEGWEWPNTGEAGEHEHEIEITGNIKEAGIHKHTIKVIGGGIKATGGNEEHAHGISLPTVYVAVWKRTS